MRTDRFAQYVVDIGVASHAASELIENLDHVFQQIKRAWLKLSREKSQFGKQSIDIFGKTISTARIAPIEERITRF